MSTEKIITFEAINLMTDPISSKESCRIGTWNVRTMNESTKTAQIVREMTSYNLGILGIAIGIGRQYDSSRLKDSCN